MCPIDGTPKNQQTERILWTLGSVFNQGGQTQADSRTNPDWSQCLTHSEILLLSSALWLFLGPEGLCAGAKRQCLGAQEHTSPFPRGVDFVESRPSGMRDLRLTAHGIGVEILQRLSEDLLVGTGARKVDQHAAYGESYLCADLEQFESNAATGGFGHAGPLQRYAA